MSHKQKVFEDSIDINEVEIATLKERTFLKPLKDEKPNINDTIKCFDTTNALCDHIQTLIYNHLSNQSLILDSTTQHLDFVEIDKNISELKQSLLTFSKINSPKHQRTTTKDQDTVIDRWATQTTRGASSRGALTKTLSFRDHPLYSIDESKHCWCIGSMRQDWNTIELEENDRNWKELKPTWFELFFDLMFVASIVHISSETVYLYDHGHGSLWFIFQVFAQFGLFALCWMEHVLYQSRFRMQQFFDELLELIYMALILMMGISISNNEVAHKSFLVSYGLSKLTMCIMLIKSSMIPRAKNHAIFMISEKIISIVVTICVLWFVNIEHESNEKYMTMVYLIIYASLFIYSYAHIIIAVYCDCIRHLGINIPINIPHIAERMGAFVLIISGETIISIVVQHFESSYHSILFAYSLTMGFFFIVYSTGKLYFESQPTEHDIYYKVQSHAMSKSVWRSRIYCLTHFILFFGLLGVGLGSKLITHHVDNHTIVFLTGISCIVTLISIAIIRLTHPFDYKPFNKTLIVAVWIGRIVLILLMLGSLFIHDMIDEFYILIIYVVCFIVHICIDFESRERLKQHDAHNVPPQLKLQMSAPTSGTL